MNLQSPSCFLRRIGLVWWPVDRRCVRNENFRLGCPVCPTLGCLGRVCRIVNLRINLSHASHWFSDNRNSSFWFQTFLVILLQFSEFRGTSRHRPLFVFRCKQFCCNFFFRFGFYVDSSFLKKSFSLFLDKAFFYSRFGLRHVRKRRRYRRWVSMRDVSLWEKIFSILGIYFRLRVVSLLLWPTCVTRRSGSKPGCAHWLRNIPGRLCQRALLASRISSLAADFSSRFILGDARRTKRKRDYS